MNSIAADACIDVVIVTHRSVEVITECLESLRSPLVASITIVDSANSDHDGLAATKSVAGAVSSWSDARDVSVSFIALGINVGFGTAANRGVATGHARYVFIVNPDTVLAPTCLELLAKVLANDDALAAVGPLVRNSDGTMYPSARSFPSLVDAAGHAFLGTIRPTNRFTRRYLGDPERPEWISGTAFLTRRTDYERVGGFDESYFMYVEDVDLCWRWAQAGRRVGWVREAELTHLIGSSSGSAPLRMVVEHHRSLWRFARRTSSPLVLPVVLLGLVLRTLLLFVRHRFRPTPPASSHVAPPATH